MIRYGINLENNFGISIYQLRLIAKEIGKNHNLALELWNSKIHDVRLISCFIDDFEKITTDQVGAWVHDFYSWDLCDQACTSLFDLSSLVFEKVFQ